MSGTRKPTTGVAERQLADGQARHAALCQRLSLPGPYDDPEGLVALWAAVRPGLTPRAPEHPVSTAYAPAWFGSPGWYGYDHWDDDSLDTLAAAVHQVMLVLLKATPGSTVVDGMMDSQDEGVLVIRSPDGTERNPLRVVRHSLADHYNGTASDGDLLTYARATLVPPDPDAPYEPERLQLRLRSSPAGLLRRRPTLAQQPVHAALARLGAVPDEIDPQVHSLFAHDLEWRATFRLSGSSLAVSLGGQPEGDRRGTDAEGLQHLLLALCTLCEQVDGELQVERPESARTAALFVDGIPRVLQAIGATPRPKRPARGRARRSG